MSCKTIKNYVLYKNLMKLPVITEYCISFMMGQTMIDSSVTKLIIIFYNIIILTKILSITKLRIEFDENGWS